MQCSGGQTLITTTVFVAPVPAVTSTVWPAQTSTVLIYPVTVTTTQLYPTPVTVPVPVPVPVATTWYPAVVTTYAPLLLTTYRPAVVTSYLPVVIAASTPVVQQQWYCSTLTARGDNLPQVRQGACGTILVVNAGRRLGMDHKAMLGGAGAAGVWMAWRWAWG